MFDEFTFHGATGDSAPKTYRLKGDYYTSEFVATKDPQTTDLADETITVDGAQCTNECKEFVVTMSYSTSAKAKKFIELLGKVADAAASIGPKLANFGLGFDFENPVKEEDHDEIVKWLGKAGSKTIMVPYRVKICANGSVEVKRVDHQSTIAHVHWGKETDTKRLGWDRKGETEMQVVEDETKLTTKGVGVIKSDEMPDGWPDHTPADLDPRND